MRKFKLFSYLLIAGMLFSNASMYAMEGQNQNLGNEENQTQEKEKPALAVIVSPFYDSSFKTIFSVNSSTDKENENLKGLICEMFPNAIEDSDEIEVANPEINPGVPPHGSGKLIADIPFTVKTNDGDCRALYDVEMQQIRASRDSILSRLKDYGQALREKLGLKECPMTLIALLGKGFSIDDFQHLKLASFDIRTGALEENRFNFTDKILLMPILHFAQNNHFDGHEIPEDGWCRILGYCLQRIGQQLFGGKRIDVVNSPKGKKLVELLGTEGERGRKLAELIAENEVKAEEDMREASRQEGIMLERKKIVFRLSKKRNKADFKEEKQALLDEEIHCGGNVDTLTFIKQQHFKYYKRKEFNYETIIAKKLKLSSKEESESLPTSTKKRIKSHSTKKEGIKSPTTK